MRKQLQKRQEQLRKGMQQVFPEARNSINTGNGKVSEPGNVIASNIITNDNDSINVPKNRDGQHDAAIEATQEHHLTKQPTSHHRSNSLNRMQQLLLLSDEEANNMSTNTVTVMDSPSFKSIEACVVDAAECSQDNKGL